jgi:SCP-2 sterol transfer family
VKKFLGERLIRLDRNRLVHWLLMRVMSRAIAMRFDPSAANDLEATLELALRDPYGRPASRYQLHISGMRCAVRRGAAPSAGARASVGSDDLILLATGGVAWPELFSSGRFELTGDPFLALRFASLFRLPVVLDAI